jgi:hypothetical protein
MNGQPIWTNLVTSIDYDAKGQRVAIVLGNGTETQYSHDPETFRLTGLQPWKTSSPDALQDL